jgi:hypothetical protein
VVCSGCQVAGDTCLCDRQRGSCSLDPISLMLSAIRCLPSSPPPYRVSIRRNVVKLNRKYHAKVSGRRFHDQFNAFWVQDADPFAYETQLFRLPSPRMTLSGTSRLGRPWLAWAKVSWDPCWRSTFRILGLKPLQPDDFKAVYIPVWFIDGEVTGNVTKSGTEVRGVDTVQRVYGSHDWLGSGDDSFVELVRLAC